MSSRADRDLLGDIQEALRRARDRDRGEDGAAGESDFGPGPRSGPPAEPPHPTRQDQEVAGFALPRRDQGDPGWPPGRPTASFWPPSGMRPSIKASDRSAKCPASTRFEGRRQLELRDPSSG